ncbi:hypothetical protein D9M68_989690 [compost metagenome]
MGGGHQAAACALEQHHAQLRFQLPDVAAYCGLACGQGARGRHQAAVVQRGQKRADQGPVEVSGMHMCMSGVRFKAIVYGVGCFHNRSHGAGGRRPMEFPHA